jgi:ATP-dependent DNA helicase RecG
VFDIPTFNESVIRESLLNSVSHRSHQMSASVFVRQYKDRLVVESPGGLPNGLSLDNILSKQIPRNRRIAEIFALCGLVERAGQGMNLMYELGIREAKSLPSFSGTDSNFVTLTLNGKVLDVQMLLLMDRIGSKQLEALSTDEFLIIDALFFKRKLSDYLQSQTKRLIEMDIIERIGKNKFALARRLYSATDKSSIHTRHVKLDRDSNKSVMYNLIKNNGDRGTTLNELQRLLPSHSRNQLQFLLREMRDENSIYLEGKTRSAKWFATAQND